jgi:hypothetical protein
MSPDSSSPLAGRVDSALKSITALDTSSSPTPHAQFAIISDPARSETSYGVFRLPRIPILDEARNGASLNTEGLFGEAFQCLETAKGWTRVKLLTNGEEGWIDVPFVKMTAEELAAHSTRGSNLLRNRLITVDDGQFGATLTLGASIPTIDPKSGVFRIGSHEFHVEGAPDLLDKPLHTRKEFVRAALTFVGTGYAWGGRSVVSGADCSGLCVTAGRFIGLELPHSANKTWKTLSAVSGIEEAKSGDLLFYGRPEAPERASHVGILLKYKNGHNFMLHASGEVRINPLSPNLSYNHESPLVFRGIGRIL